MSKSIQVCLIQWNKECEVHQYAIRNVVRSNAPSSHLEWRNHEWDDHHLEDLDPWCAHEVQLTQHRLQHLLEIRCRVEHSHPSPPETVWTTLVLFQCIATPLHRQHQLHRSIYEDAVKGSKPRIPTLNQPLLPNTCYEKLKKSHTKQPCWQSSQKRSTQCSCADVILPLYKADKSQDRLTPNSTQRSPFLKATKAESGRWLLTNSMSIR